MKLFMAIANIVYGIINLISAAKKKGLRSLFLGLLLLAAGTAFGFAAVKSGELEISFGETPED